MNRAFKFVMCVFLGVAFLAGGVAQAQQKEIPEALKPWEAWGTWGDKHPDCPTPYNSADQHICFWPSRLTLSANQNEGGWAAGIRVFEETWVPLPGSGEIWPLNVRANGEVIPVLQRNASPFVRLSAGLHQLSGNFRWEQMPQQIAIPRQVGILSLVVEGSTVPIPNWDANGNVWLKRIRGEVADKDLLAVQIYRVVEDGIPLWLRTEIELSVSGKSREEQLGWILPQGWKLSLVDSPLPTAIDDSGRMKAQVRAGKWTIRVDAFRTTDAGEIRFARDAQPAVDRELIAFRANPNFRMAEFEGVQGVDATQTTFPDKWRNLPVFEWQTETSFRLVEKIRGMGHQHPKGLAISRQFWLDEDGRGLTYHDTIRGRMQRIWRLDVAEGHELGSIRVDGKGQLITSNPQTGEHGVEIRTRNLNLEAVGRIERTSNLPATGWQSSAESLDVTLMLPPGWRVFALFGADQVDGDWLTAWTLLDLFLLLIFSLAVFRLWGFKAGVVAFLAFGLAYHEPGSPRLTWFFLLIPVALLRVAPEGAGKRWLTRWKFLSAALLALFLVPFITRQVQSTIYPQLETRGMNYAARGMFRQSRRAPRRDAFDEVSLQQLGDASSMQLGMARRLGGVRGVISERLDEAVTVGKSYRTSNLAYDPQARIQTGPAEPQWTWNQVHCTWNGPVSAEQQIRPVLISLSVHRVVTVVRLALLLILAAILCGVRRISSPIAKQTVAAAVVLLTCFGASPSYAQFPDQKMLD
ncbi:MAG: hypothetical protein IH831_05205, partial [Planctomycetes bacterium]|nr:hypothetical protein [Planctomycetota bacterium]